MSETRLQGDKPVELYHRYVAEPESKRDVYGYWLFLLGCLAGLAGILIFQFEQAFMPGNLEVREIAIVLAAFGLSTGLFGIVVLLPVRRRGMHASVVGLLISFVAIGGFTWAYPQAWYVEPDYSPEIIGIYAVGITIIAAVGVLVPLVTGERGLLVEPELGLGPSDPPILIGDAARDAFYSIYQTPSNDWTWRVIQRDAIGESLSLSRTDTDAKLHIEAIRDKIGAAGLLEITTSAFRLYQTEEGSWRWSLARDNGTVVATSADTYPTRDEVETDTNFCKEQLPVADIVEIRGAAFDVYADDGDRWHWRLVDDERQPLAVSTDQYTDEATAEGATRTFQTTVADARRLVVPSIATELREADAGWRWRMVDADGRPVLSAASGFDARRGAESDASQIAEALTDAAVIDHGEPHFEVTTAENQWVWRLRNATDDVIAARHGSGASKDDVIGDAERTRDALSETTTLEFTGADYEVYPANGAWHWRLVTDDRQVLAESTETYDDAEAAEAAVDHVHERAQVADLIEFEQAAFQQYESEGEWRWRLIDEDGQVMADSGEAYASKEDVTEGMRTLKEHAPDAEVLEIDTAAFELYRTESGTYAWRLIDEGGKLIAEGATDFDTRSAARSSVEYVTTHVDDAAIRAVETALFQLRPHDDEWDFLFIHPDGSILAEAVERYPTRDDALDAIETVRTDGETAAIEVTWPLAFQVFANGEFHWRLIDPDRTILATGERTHRTREAVMDEINTIRADARSAPVYIGDEPHVWITATDGAWRWVARDGDGTAIAEAPSTASDRKTAADAAERVQSLVEEAGYFDIETAAFEVIRVEDGWSWRLLDGSERVVAECPTVYPHRDEVRSAIDELRDIGERASILEIDEVAFEFHERDGGWIWRLVDEHGAPVAESVQPHDSRQSAREEMLVIKEHAPDGEIRLSH